ncbi:MAG: hypothetical protein RSA08_04395 [Clostridia bacterium]
MIKRKIIIIIFSICCYFLLSFIYNKFILNSENAYIYVLKNDVKKSDKVSQDLFDKIPIKKSTLKNNYFESIEKLNSDFVFSRKLYAGKIIEEKDLESKKNMLVSEKGKEYISLKIDNVDDFLSYQIKKEDKVNLYFTYKTGENQNISLTAKGKTYIEEEGYTTAQLLQGVEIIDTFDKYGNNIKKEDIKTSQTSILDTIMIEVDSNVAILLANIKQTGRFSISL